MVGLRWFWRSFLFQSWWFCACGGCVLGVCRKVWGKVFPIVRGMVFQVGTENPLSLLISPPQLGNQLAFLTRFQYLQTGSCFWLECGDMGGGKGGGSKQHDTWLVLVWEVSCFWNYLLKAIGGLNYISSPVTMMQVWSPHALLVFSIQNCSPWGVAVAFLFGQRETRNASSLVCLKRLRDSLQWAADVVAFMQCWP